MTPRMLKALILGCAVLTGCTGYIGVEDADAQSEPASVGSVEQALTSGLPYRAMYLPASRQVLCVFADASVYRGSATSTADASAQCARRARNAAPGSFAVRFKQTKLRTGQCRNGLLLDGAPVAERIGVCESSLYFGGSARLWTVVTPPPNPAQSWGSFFDCAWDEIAHGNDDIGGTIGNIVACAFAEDE